MLIVLWIAVTQFSESQIHVFWQMPWQKQTYRELEGFPEHTEQK